MAKAGFAGSLIVQAGWRGKGMSKGIKRSSNELKAFSRSVKGLLALASAGVAAVGGAFAIRGVVALVKRSTEGAAAWNRWQEAVEKVKNQIAKLIAGPAQAVLTWAADFLGLAAGWLTKFDSLSELINEGILPAVRKVSNVVTTLVNTVINSAIEKLRALFAVLQNIARFAVSGVVENVSATVNTVTNFATAAGQVL
ncbi:MAG: hypothetical protein VXX33_05270 [Pseudomonadota bacterium]|nr:hypothetical protein [Pseudomonadota bacterium]MEC7419849.1 hypothetical protein [Pseudomonadota bacterium]MEC8785927.1 hypothetical protein [Pseudomonadota bacterium]